MQKLGGSDKSVDQEFETHRENWEKMVKAITNIDKELKKQKKMESK